MAAGTDLAYRREPPTYWADDFDWPAQERWLNSFAHYVAEMDGVRIHFVHERARSGRGIPLLLTNRRRCGSGGREWSAPVTTRAGSAASSRIRTYVGQPRLWNVDDPQLYGATVRVRAADAVVDEQHTKFGIRSLRLDPDHGLRINGETVKLRGACVHHDNGPWAPRPSPAPRSAASAAQGRGLQRDPIVAPSDEHRDARRLRPARHAGGRRGVRHVDLGQDPFDYSLDFAEWWERDVEAMVTKDYNHPSVILYSIGNEIPETRPAHRRRPGAACSPKRSARWTTPASSPTAVNGNVLALLPVFTAQRPGEPRTRASTRSWRDSGFDSERHRRIRTGDHPHRRVLQRPRRGRDELLGKPLRDRPSPVPEPDHRGRARRSRPASTTYWQLVRQPSHVIGDFTWTGWDYLGEVGIGRAATPTGRRSSRPRSLDRRGAATSTSPATGGPPPTTARSSSASVPGRTSPSGAPRTTTGPRRSRVGGLGVTRSGAGPGRSSRERRSGWRCTAAMVTRSSFVSTARPSHASPWERACRWSRFSRPSTNRGAHRGRLQERIRDRPGHTALRGRRDDSDRIGGQGPAGRG